MNALLLSNDDDDIVIFEDILTSVLGKVSCEVKRDDKSALSFLQSGFAADLIFIDLNSLTEKSVRSFLNVVRKENGIKPRIVGYANFDLVKENYSEKDLKDLGVEGLVRKTSDIKELRKAVSKIMNGGK
jgi:hypothetical protein